MSGVVTGPAQPLEVVPDIAAASRAEGSVMERYAGALLTAFARLAVEFEVEAA